MGYRYGNKKHEERITDRHIQFLNEIFLFSLTGSWAGAVPNTDKFLLSWSSRDYSWFVIFMISTHYVVGL